jgi:hypothetical protein
MIMDGIEVIAEVPAVVASSGRTGLLIGGAVVGVAAIATGGYFLCRWLFSDKKEEPVSIVASPPLTKDQVVKIISDMIGAPSVGTA